MRNTISDYSKLFYWLKFSPIQTYPLSLPFFEENHSGNCFLFQLGAVEGAWDCRLSVKWERSLISLVLSSPQSEVDGVN